MNNENDDRGWRITFHMPYASLGLSKPAEGSQWRMALISHDRDSRDGPPGTAFIWPEAAERDAPATWAVLRYGLPSYSPPAVRNPTTLLIREGENGAVVPDAAVGGTISNQCPGDSYHIWNEWGNLNYADENSALIQNQGDIADWPCFAKYYLTFPLDRLPPGKVIRSAQLVLHHWGGSGIICTNLDQNPNPDCARSSYLQILTIVEPWEENTLTWNNAPLAFENVAVLQVDPYNINQPGEDWPGAAREWDVSYALAKAYEQGSTWISFAVYSSDSAYHSGKYFSASETEEWNKVGRPTLIIEYGD
uniref:DNRLRE domain-containing protein n=1 Tax=Bellilinea caldifistulae TaxID=360411 RepID=A0A7C4L0W6_9CHLR